MGECLRIEYILGELRVTAETYASAVSCSNRSVIRTQGISCRAESYSCVEALCKGLVDAVVAALATAVAQFISAALPIGVLLKLPDTPLKLRCLSIDRELLSRILKIGVPAGLQFVTFDFSNILIQSGINSFGDVVMAAWTAHGKTDSITWMISGAFGVAVTTFVGQNFGARKYRRIRQSVWACTIMSVSMVYVWLS